MLAPNIVAEVVRLLAEGRLSQRQIAGVLGISRGSVGTIAQGQRTHERRADALFDPTRPLGLPRRCPTCGGLVYLQCLLCRIRRIKDRDRAAAGTSALSTAPNKVRDVCDAI